MYMYSASQTLSDDQTAWVKLTTERVLKILRETPPDGELFTDTVTVRQHAVFHRCVLITYDCEIC